MIGQVGPRGENVVIVDNKQGTPSYNNGYSSSSTTESDARTCSGKYSKI